MGCILFWSFCCCYETLHFLPCFCRPFLSTNRLGVLATERRRIDITNLPQTCTIIGAPMTFGQPYVGTDTSPMNLRQAGLVQKLSALSWRIQDMGNLDFARMVPTAEQISTLSTFRGNAINVLEIGAGTHQLARSIETVLRQENHFPLILGGDHSIGIGSLAGILKAQPNTGVLWIDAHADINTPFITESGNMHGMPLGFLMADILERTAHDTGNASTIPGFEWLQNEYTNRLSHDQLVYVGLRDVDIEERKLIASLGIKAFTMTEIDRTSSCSVALASLLSLIHSNVSRYRRLWYWDCD
jgi:arginase